MMIQRPVWQGRISPGRVTNSLANRCFARANLLMLVECGHTYQYDHILGIHGVPTSVSGAAAFAITDGIIGPSVDFAKGTTRQRIVYSSHKVMGDVDLTFAAILRPDTLSGNSIFMSNSGVSNGNWVYFNSSTVVLGMGGAPADTTLTGATISTTDPWLVICSRRASDGQIYATCINLRTYAVNVGSGTNTGVVPDGDGVYSVGSASFSDSSFDGKIAAAYIGNIFLNNLEQRSFISDPWALWRMDDPVYAFKAPAAATFKAAWARGSNVLIGCHQ